MKTPSFRLVLLCAAVSLVMLSVSVAVGCNLPGGRTMDFVFTQAEVKRLISEYSARDIAAHRWVTSRFDMFFPFAYGAFFYFASMRYANMPWVLMLVLWVMVGTIFDFTENAAQLSLLNGEDSSALKTVFTRAKFVFLAIPIVFCTVNFLLDIKSGGNRKVRRRD